MPILDARVIASALNVLARGELARYYTEGVSEVERFEGELAKYVGVNYALGVNSGTSALICALIGLGIGPGDEVLVPAYTWVATAAAPLAVGAVPVLTDIDWSLTIDPEDIKRKISPQTKAIVVVHMLNLVCDMDAIMAIAREHDLVVIEDACQAIGITYRGRRVGSIGHAGAFSFQRNKNIQAGEGGAVLTNRERVHARATMYHDVGSYTRNGRAAIKEPLFVGQNYRMSNLAAAILRPQLRRLDAQLDVRRARRRYWLDKLANRIGHDFEVSPHHDPASAAALTLRFASPDDARAFAKRRGVERLLDTGRHVYRNWESLLSGHSPHPKLDSYARAARDVRVREDSCPRTLDILARTCVINMRPDLPMAAYRMLIGTER